MPQDFNKEWREKASIDYFSPFITLWLACNSWYMYHYADLNDLHPGDNKANDRHYIDKLKTDTSSRNHLYVKFADMIALEGKDGIAFRTDIELLHYALERAEISSDKTGFCSFRSAVIDYANKNSPIDLIKNPHLKQDGTVYTDEQDDVIKLDQIYITSNVQHCFAGIFEIIYQVRNMLVHGRLCPEKEEHEVVKYCYRLLWVLMS